MKEVIKLDAYTIDEFKRFIGNHESNIRLLESAFDTEIIIRGDELLFSDTQDKLNKIKDVINTVLNF